MIAAMNKLWDRHAPRNVSTKDEQHGLDWTGMDGLEDRMIVSVLRTRTYCNVQYMDECKWRSQMVARPILASTKVLCAAAAPGLASIEETGAAQFPGARFAGEE